jgi:hypothetical protein
MPTLLANRKMHPSLAARVAASVSGRRNHAVVRRSTARLVSLVRLVAVAGVAALVIAIVLTKHRERVEFRRARTALLELWTKQSAALTAADSNFLGRLETILVSGAGEYKGDFVAEALRPTGAFTTALARPAVYVRGSMATLASSAGVIKAASESGKDALLLCLLDPPAERTEKQLLPKARIALGGGTSLSEVVPNVRRLHDAEVGLPFLLPSWGERVQNAKEPQDLVRLERELKKAPLEATKRVLRSELLIAVYDEPNEGSGVTELDGEHAHAVRLVVIDLASGNPLLRFRKQVDPSWITPNRRSMYARELDGCKFALDVRQAVSP